MKLVKSLIVIQVIVASQGSEYHLTFVRVRRHIAEQDPRIDHKTSWMAIASVPPVVSLFEYCIQENFAPVLFLPF